MEIHVEVIDRDGRPIAAMPMRVVVGSEPDSRSRQAGEWLVTDAQGRAHRRLDVRMTRRGIGLGIPFVSHPAEMIEVGFETRLGGLPILYALELDHVKQGTMISQQAWTTDRHGRFEAKLNFDWDGHSTNSEYRSPPQEGRFQPVADVPPARLGFAYQMLTPQALADGAREWRLDTRLKILPYTPRIPPG